MLALEGNSFWVSWALGELNSIGLENNVEDDEESPKFGGQNLVLFSASLLKFGEVKPILDTL